MNSINTPRIVIQTSFAIVIIVLLTRLYLMQVSDTTYQAMANQNSIRQISVSPGRGLVYDRNGALVINNEPVYDIMVIPKKAAGIDTNKFCKLLDITKMEFLENATKLRLTRGEDGLQQVFMRNISPETFLNIQEYLYQFPGFSGQIRTIRKYEQPYACHVLGYVGEVNKKHIDTSDNYYQPSDYIGISGIEASHEIDLRGKKGTKFVEVDVRNREIGSLKEGLLDVPAVGGKDLMLTIDMKLQAYAEELMQNKKGSIVAIEPSTGEILALVSSPYYNPTILTGKKRGEGMKSLINNPHKPLFNRALMAYYPPGSTFKPLMGLIGLQENIINADFYFGCYGGYYLKNLRIGCHYHGPCYNMEHALLHSCNSYFCQIFKLLTEDPKYGGMAKGLDVWHDYLTEFGLGRKINVDLYGALSGYVPTSQFFNKKYGKKRWRASTLISLGIGQGELGVTPIQLANMTAIFANRGYFYYPHVIRVPSEDTTNMYNKMQKTRVERRHFERVINGMERVVLEGSATIAYVSGLSICGKTGTAENPHGKPHSLFEAFAPKKNPQIAILVMVENAGWGKHYAAPIASLIIEKYLKGDISPSRKELEYKMKYAYLM